MYLVLNGIERVEGLPFSFFPYTGSLECFHDFANGRLFIHSQASLVQHPNPVRQDEISERGLVTDVMTIVAVLVQPTFVAGHKLGPELSKSGFRILDFLRQVLATECMGHQLEVDVETNGLDRRRLERGGAEEAKLFGKVVLRWLQEQK